MVGLLLLGLPHLFDKSQDDTNFGGFLPLDDPKVSVIKSVIC